MLASGNVKQCVLDARYTTFGRRPTSPDAGVAGVHLIGLPSTHGDFNITWGVFLVIFTDQGVAEGAINHRILTLTNLNAAVARNDALEAPLMTPSRRFSFNCSITSETTYVKGRR